MLEECSSILSVVLLLNTNITRQITMEGGGKPTSYKTVKKTIDFQEKDPFKSVCRFHYYYFRCFDEK